MKVLAIDTGGTQTRIGLFHDGSLVSRTSFATTDLQALLDAVKQLAPGGFDAAGIAFAGALDMRQGRILYAPNLTQWQGMELPPLLRDAWKTPVYMGNDATCAALGELTAGSRASDFAYVTWSTGIGGGLVSGGRVLWGRTGMAAEVGHMVLQPDGPTCNCGKAGCLEALASGSGIRRITERRLGRPLSAKETTARAQAAEPIPVEIMQAACIGLGQGLAILSEVLEPELFVLGGGITRSWAYLGPQVERALASMARTPPPIRLTELGDDVGLHGAAALPTHWPEKWPPPAK